MPGLFPTGLRSVSGGDRIGSVAAQDRAWPPARRTRIRHAAPVRGWSLHATMRGHLFDDAAMSDLDTLRTLALQAAQHAYAPYSRLRVGAALRSAAGHVYLGCNVENASYTLGNCAERAAIAAAVQAEGTAFQLAAIAVIAFDASDCTLPISPCGGCRQALVEFGEDAAVSFRQPDGQWCEVSAAALLPYRFRFPETPS